MWRACSSALFLSFHFGGLNAKFSCQLSLLKVFAIDLRGEMDRHLRKMAVWRAGVFQAVELPICIAFSSRGWGEGTGWQLDAAAPCGMPPQHPCRAPRTDPDLSRRAARPCLGCSTSPAGLCAGLWSLLQLSPCTSGLHPQHARLLQPSDLAKLQTRGVLLFVPTAGQAFRAACGERRLSASQATRAAGGLSRSFLCISDLPNSIRLCSKLHAQDPPEQTVGWPYTLCFLLREPGWHSMSSNNGPSVVWRELVQIWQRQHLKTSFKWTQWEGSWVEGELINFIPM